MNKMGFLKLKKSYIKKKSLPFSKTHIHKIHNKCIVLEVEACHGVYLQKQRTEEPPLESWKR